jgi:hypothetical protein
LDRGAPGDKPTHTTRDQHTLSAISTTQRHERKINNETAFFKEQALSTKDTPTRTNKQLTQLQKDFNLTKQSKILTRHTNRRGKKTTTHTNHPLHPDFYALKNHRPLYSPNPQTPTRHRKTKKTKGPLGPGWGKPLQGQTSSRTKPKMTSILIPIPIPSRIQKGNRVIAILSKLSPIGCNLTKTTKLACSTHVQHATSA